MQTKDLQIEHKKASERGSKVQKHAEKSTKKRSLLKNSKRDQSAKKPLRTKKEWAKDEGVRLIDSQELTR